jgi:hypothetical protein
VVVAVDGGFFGAVGVRLGVGMGVRVGMAMVVVSAVPVVVFVQEEHADDVES